MVLTELPKPLPKLLPLSEVVVPVPVVPVLVLLAPGVEPSVDAPKALCPELNEPPVAEVPLVPEVLVGVNDCPKRPVVGTLASPK